MWIMSEWGVGLNMYVCNYCGHKTTILKAMKMHQEKHLNDDSQIYRWHKED